MLCLNLSWLELYCLYKAGIPVRMMDDLFRQYIHMSSDGAVLLLHHDQERESKGKEQR